MGRSFSGDKSPAVSEGILSITPLSGGCQPPERAGCVCIRAQGANAPRSASVYATDAVVAIARNRLAPEAVAVGGQKGIQCVEELPQAGKVIHRRDPGEQAA